MWVVVVYNETRRKRIVEKAKGKLIIIEGLDKSGKTTQSKLAF